MEDDGTTHEIDLTGTRIRYRDEGSGTPVVFVHGLLVNGLLWRNVAPGVAAAGHRSITPDWPLGAHAVPVPGADLSPPGVADLVARFLEALDLRDVTLVANDTGGAITQILLTRRPERVGRVVLKHPVPPEIADAYLAPARQNAQVRNDLRRFLRGVHRRYTLEAAERLGGFDKPVLLAWAREDRLFPISCAHRLAARLPKATVVPVDDSYTFIPEDQPAVLTRLIIDFCAEPATP